MMNKLFFLSMLVCGALFAGHASASALNAFSSDGCSLFVDGTVNDRKLWCDCCFRHDIAYWRGGSEDERKEADRALQACVLERTGNQALAEMMHDGVRIGGSPIFPTWYRWGYGWKYGRGYQPLTDEEQNQAVELFEQYQKDHPSAYCRTK